MLGRVVGECRQVAGLLERLEITLQLQKRADQFRRAPRAFGQAVLGFLPSVGRRGELIESAPGHAMKIALVVIVTSELWTNILLKFVKTRQSRNGGLAASQEI